MDLLPRSSVLVWAAATLLAIAQAQPRPDQPPTFRTEANYVRVDVYPTIDGKPVLDLTRDDFEVFEDGVAQNIDAFEHIVIRPAGPQETRREPNNVRESREALENPRARVFVLFLDIGHVELASSRTIRKPLVEALNGIIGQDDLVAVMTPEMSAGDVTFARRTTTIEGIVGRFWWGERDRLTPTDPIESQYMLCYPGSGARTSPVAQEMIERRREKLTLDALEDLALFLRGLREERKAILVITDGWRLFRPNEALANATGGRQPSLPPIGVDPRTGKLSGTNTANPQASLLADCDVERMRLAAIDDDLAFRRLLDAANRANASFYPIDPRGLSVFDAPIGPDPPPPISVDMANLKNRAESLRTLAVGTDGTALLDTNDLAGGLRRIVSDLTSYYLVGYYSARTKPDGQFHAIRVRVKRPGVQVRARRGYLAARPDERAGSTSRARADSVPALDEAAAAEARAIDATIAGLANVARDVPLRVRAVSGWKPAAGGQQRVVWTVGEVAASDDWKAGAEIDVMLTAASGTTVASARASLAAGSRSFLTTLAPSTPLTPGEYLVMVRGRGLSPSAARVNESVRVTVADDTTGAILMRRGQSTGNRETPTADVRFRRGEQLRVDVPVLAASAVSARLLDRTGKPMNVPVSAAERESPDGSRWHTAQLALAPLAVGDYILEIASTSGGGATNGAHRTLVGFKVIP